jgi:hypothetical protein
LHLTTQFYGLVAPIELVGLACGEGQRDKHPSDRTLMLGSPTTNRALKRRIGSLKPSCASVSYRRRPLRRSRSGLPASSRNNSSKRAAHGPITGKRFGRELYLGWVALLLRYFLTVLREAPRRRAI